MKHWTRTLIFVAILAVGLFAGGAWAAPNALGGAEPVAHETTAEVESVSPEEAAPEADVQPTEPAVAPEEAVQEPEAAPPTEVQDELFLPYPIFESEEGDDEPVIVVNYDRIFAWLDRWLERYDLEGSEQLVETWKSLAEQLEERPVEEWHEIIDELGQLGMEWFHEQLDLMQAVRQEVRSGLKELRDETLDMLRDRLQFDNEAPRVGEQENDRIATD